MVITNIMVWIYCFRGRHHTGIYTYVPASQWDIINCHQYIHTYVGTSSELHKPTKDTTNPAYHTITDDYNKTETPISYYEKVNVSSNVKMTPNPAYAVP